MAGSLGLLLELLLLLGVGEPDPDLELFALRLDGVIVEGLDDLFAVSTGLEAVDECQRGVRD